VTWVWARFRCWRAGHDLRLLTADLRFAGCLCCGAQVTTSAAMRRALAPGDEELDGLLAVEVEVSDA
jgi:hypothetical protein